MITLAALCLSLGLPGASTPMAEPPRLLGPRRAPERAKALQRNGGSEASEQAVVAGLDWLRRHQDDSGGWDADGFAAHCDPPAKACQGVGKGQHGEDQPCPFDAPISALCLLAFLGHGHLPDDADDANAEVVARAIEYVRLNAAGTWALPLALEALAEAETLEGKGRLTEDVGELAAALLQRRQEDGGFGYATPFRPGSDVPYTALAVSALLAARDAGVALPDDLAPRIDAFLGSLEETKGQLAYLRDGRRYGYTPTSTNGHLAAAIRELLQVGTAGTRHRAHLALMAREKPQWRISFRTVEVPGRGNMSVQVGNLSLYQWWYGSIASFQHGGSAWSGWQRATRDALSQNQQRHDCAQGSFDPLGTYERQTGGRVFATALAVLILEQPYRQRRLDDS